MQNIKVIFVVLIIVIAEISFNHFAQAAEVTRIHSSRKYIFINSSIADGFVMGARVCFYSSSGEEITCGPIEQASESFAKVRVNNRIAKKIRYGMEARLSAEKSDEKVTKEDKGCVDDSECGDAEVCINGKCQKTQW